MDTNSLPLNLRLYAPNFAFKRGNLLLLFGSVAEWFGGSFLYGHDRKVGGSTPTQVSLLRRWIRHFTTIISAWWNLTSSKLKKIQAENSETRATPKRV